MGISDGSEAQIGLVASTTTVQARIMAVCPILEDCERSVCSLQKFDGLRTSIKADAES